MTDLTPDIWTGPPTAPSASPVPDSRLTDDDLDDLVDRVVERIESRIVDELERRGRHRLPGMP